MNNQLHYWEHSFLQSYVGDQLNNDYIQINNVIIPNFLQDHRNNILLKETMIFEFNHLIYKIFFSKKNTNLTFYETDNFYIKENDIVFDCGANMGLFSAAAAVKCKHVYSFEPMSLIRKNLTEIKNLYSNITIIPKGLWNDCNNQILYQKDNPGASSVFNTNKVNKTLYRENCQMTTIDQFIEETGIIPTFIKVDIEGAEIQLLEGAQNCLKTFAPKVAIDLHYLHENEINYIKSLLQGYTLEIFPQPCDEGLTLLGEKK